MNKIVDLTGHQYGRLKVLSMCPERRKSQVMWLCLCDCGKQHAVSNAALQSGSTKSCGCMRATMLGDSLRTHGMTKTTEYGSWHQMLQRCNNHNNKSYPDYGGRGIRVHPDWVGKGGFDAFFAYMGSKPSAKHSLDRYPDVNGNYEPGNLRWATQKEQVDNRRNSRWLEHDGKKMVMGDWAKELKIEPTLLWLFLKKHSIKEAIEKYQGGGGGGLTYLNQTRKRRFFGKRSKTSKYARNVLTFHPEFKVWYQISMYAYYSIIDKKEIPMAMVTFYSNEDPLKGSCHSVPLVDKGFNAAFAEAKNHVLISLKTEIQ